MIVPFCLGVAVATLGFAGGKIGRWIHGKIKQLRLKRWEARIAAIGPSVCGKYLRHRPTGQIGLCVGVALTHKWKLVVEMVTCPGCAAAVKESGAPALMMARIQRCTRLLEHAEVVAALSGEIAEFKTPPGGQEA